MSSFSKLIFLQEEVKHGKSEKNKWFQFPISKPGFGRTLGIQPTPKNEAFFKTLEGFRFDPKTKIWSHCLPGEKSVKCVPEHLAIHNLTIFLEKAMKRTGEQALALIFFNEEGGLPLLLKSLIENNVSEDFLKKIHGVGDVIATLSLKNDQYKNKEFVQKKYKQLNYKQSESENFDLFSGHSAKKKAKAAHLFFGRVCERMSYEESTKIIYICRYPPCYQKTGIFYQNYENFDLTHKSNEE